MSLTLNRAKMSTSTVGTGTLSLGSAVSPYQTAAAAGAVGNMVYSYLIEDGANWELGYGTYTSGSLTRNLDQSSTGSLLSLSGSATVAILLRTNDVTQVFGPPIVTTSGQTSVSFSSIPQNFSHLQIIGVIGSTSTSTTATDHIGMQFNGDTTSGHYSYESYGLYGGPTGFDATHSGSGAWIDMWGASCIGASQGFGRVQIDISGYTAARGHIVRIETDATQGNISGPLHSNGSGWWNQAAAITSINLFITANAYAIGSSFWLYLIP